MILAYRTKGQEIENGERVAPIRRTAVAVPGPAQRPPDRRSGAPNAASFPPGRGGCRFPGAVLFRRTGPLGSARRAAAVRVPGAAASAFRGLSRACPERGGRVSRAVVAVRSRGRSARRGRLFSRPRTPGLRSTREGCAWTRSAFPGPSPRPRGPPRPCPCRRGSLSVPSRLERHGDRRMPGGPYGASGGGRGHRLTDDRCLGAARRTARSTRRSRAPAQAM